MGREDGVGQRELPAQRRVGNANDDLVGLFRLRIFVGFVPSVVGRFVDHDVIMADSPAAMAHEHVDPPPFAAVSRPYARRMSEGRTFSYTDAVEWAATLPPVAEHAIRWYESSWADRIVALKDELAVLATRCVPDAKKPTALNVSRQVVFNVFADPATSARERFTAAMVWGYGTVGRGPARVANIIGRSGNTLDARLEQVIDAASSDPGTAWDTALRDAKIAYLGPSFATKVLYFAAFAGGVPDRPAPLIADVVVAHALRLRRFGRDSYVQYCTDAARAAKALSGVRRRADQIEFALFETGKTR